jgi:hypothetical protein
MNAGEEHVVDCVETKENSFCASSFSRLTRLDSLGIHLDLHLIISFNSKEGGDLLMLHVVLHVVRSSAQRRQETKALLVGFTRYLLVGLGEIVFGRSPVTA